jgi:outer membrane receptor for ferrienterochelin and colicin
LEKVQLLVSCRAEPIGEAFRSNISPRVYAVYHVGYDPIVKGGVANRAFSSGARSYNERR